MQRRKFLQAATMLPFFPHPLSGQGSPRQTDARPGPVPGLDNESPDRQTPDRQPPDRQTDHLQSAGVGESRDFFYKPDGAWAADFIPLYADGEFQLFFLLDWRDTEKHGEGTPWYRISTKDFVHFTEHGEMLPRGTKEEQDLFVFTGSAIKAEGKYHIFYTGHNPYLADRGKPMEGIMHAVSDDMQQWRKLPAQTFFSPADKYEANDWRDPFVFRNEAAGEYNMLVAARFKEGIPRRRGLTALCASKDLEHWEVRDPFYSPGLFYTHECPDHFKMGDWYYLLFSEFTDRVRTRYRMSRSPKGPWIIPKRDDFDGHAYYAAKSASDGHQRFLFGWNPTREGGKDNGGWNWGGSLVVHEILQEADGELSVRPPGTVKAAFQNTIHPDFKPAGGPVRVENGTVTIRSAGTFGAAIAGKMPPICRINTTLEFGKDTPECGLMLRVSDDLDTAYYIRLEPANNRFVFDKWPRDRADVPYMVELSRDIVLKPDTPHHLQVFIDGNKGVAYLDDKIAMNFRIYDSPEGDWGIFASLGTATFKNTTLSTL
ncbi:MAG: family 43 glycosylhydrolase [Puia sp.]|nr:family 43 glycosylhydrolase [Puia sp.]